MCISAIQLCLLKNYRTVEVKEVTENGVEKVRDGSKKLERKASKELKRADRKFDKTGKKVCKEARAAKCEIANNGKACCDSLKASDRTAMNKHRHTELKNESRRTHNKAAKVKQAVTNNQPETQK